jgi:hypothetical protein
MLVIFCSYVIDLDKILVARFGPREVLFSDVGVLVMATNFTTTGSEAWIDVANKAITIQEKQKHQGYGPIMLTGMFVDASAMIA